MSEQQKPEFIWRFDENHRVYRKDGLTSSGPIWREHWVKCRVVGETSRSWILDHYEIKVPKKGANQRLFAFTEAEVDEQAWLHVNRYKLLRAVEFCSDAAIMRQIAKLVNYEARTS